MQLQHIDFKPSGQKFFHISLCLAICYVKLFLTTGFEIDMPKLQITFAPCLDYINNWFAIVTGLQKYYDTIFLQLMVKHSIMRFAFTFAVAICLIHIHEGAIVTTSNEGTVAFR